MPVGPAPARGWSITRIIHGGVLEDYPDLKLCLLHGGGVLPCDSSPIDHSYEARPEGRHHITRPPSSYLEQVHVAVRAAGVRLGIGHERLSAVEAPVGPLSATGIHLVDLAVSTFGAPSAVWARPATRATSFANGDRLSVTLAFASGATATITAVLTTPFMGRICVLGSQGWMEIRDRSHPENPAGWDGTTVRRVDEPRKVNAAVAFDLSTHDPKAPIRTTDVGDRLAALASG